MEIVQLGVWDSDVTACVRVVLPSLPGIPRSLIIYALRPEVTQWHANWPYAKCIVVQLGHCDDEHILWTGEGHEDKNIAMHVHWKFQLDWKNAQAWAPTYRQQERSSTSPVSI